LWFLLLWLLVFQTALTGNDALNLVCGSICYDKFYLNCKPLSTNQQNPAELPGTRQTWQLANLKRKAREDVFMLKSKLEFRITKDAKQL
jgi:hypothetical protein